MAKGSITMRVENLQKLLDQVQEIDEKGRKAVKATVRDVKSRAPGWIAQEVTQVYNIKKSEITPSSGKGAKPKKMAGSIQVRGETIEEMTITYSGRRLTPVHFGMTPKTPPAGKSYTLKMQVVKGQKKVIGRYKNTRTPGGPYSEPSASRAAPTAAAGPHSGPQDARSDAADPTDGQPRKRATEAARAPHTTSRRAEGTVTRPIGLRCWRAQKTRRLEKFFSGRFVSRP